MPTTELQPRDGDDLEQDVDAAIAACGGDMRATIRALLIANAFMEGELERALAASSKGYVRKRSARGVN